MGVVVAVLTDVGGTGERIVLLHGLMGSGRTWGRQVPWLRAFGQVYVVDAEGHRGARESRAVPTTDDFVDDLVDVLGDVGPATVIGHSMGGLHGWCLAARRPDLVRALVVEDMAPDFRGLTSAGWAASIEAWPQPFPDADAVRSWFGDVAGRYFLDSFERRDDGWWLHGDVATFRAIADEWGRRDFWSEWTSVRAPVLLIEAENSVTPSGQMARMHALQPLSTHVVVTGAGHLVHDDRPEDYRRIVTDFLRAR